MTFRPSPRSLFGSNASPTTNKTRKRQTLTLEQLEARMLMAFDVIDQQIAEYSAPDVGMSCNADGTENTGAIVSASLPVQFQMVGSVNSLRSNERITTGEKQLALQVLPDADGNVPRIRWTVTSTDRLARGVAVQSGSEVSMRFTRPVEYKITAAVGTRSFSFKIRVTPTLSSLDVKAGSQRLTNAPLTVTGKYTSLSVTGLDEINRTYKLSGSVTWEVAQSPEGSNPVLVSSGTKTKIQFDRAGLYTFNVSNGSVSRTIRVNVVQTLSGVQASAESEAVVKGQRLQLSAVAVDQFQQPMLRQPRVTWSATGGSVNARGSFLAGNKTTTAQITAKIGRFSARVKVPVTNDNSNEALVSQINDTALRSLVSTYYADSIISREEMMAILRSTANDNSLSATELSDLRYIVSPSSSLKMPEYVRTLATSVVTTNAANLHYQGSSAGNLTSGSTGSLVNILVDKWFTGSDLPTILGSGISYRSAAGSLFPTTPGLSDSQQGQLGDCYFLATLISIASKNDDAVRDMFIENSDGTFTVRFYANGRADYVTVNRSVPTYSNGVLAYSGYGRSAASLSTPLWLVMAEKAYAQWNETGKEGRDGTNTYAGIEGGWMSYVYAQVLGYNASNVSVNASNKQALINALTSNQSVTIGTNQSVSVPNLVGSHAYVVTGYDANSDTFSFYNPWSTQHPAPLSWSQMQGNFSLFSFASPAGSGSDGSTVSSQITVSSLMAYVESTLDADSAELSLVPRSETPEVLQADALATNEFDPSEVSFEVVNEIAADSTSGQQPSAVFLVEHLVDLSIMELQA